MGPQRIDLDKPSYATARFKVICAVGRSLRANLKKLFDATHRKSNPNWSEIVDALSKFTDGILLRSSGASHNQTQQIELARATLLGLAKTWAQNPQLVSVMTEIANGIVPFERGELASHLQQLYRAGFNLAQDCVKHWGGQRSLAIIKLLKENEMRLIFATEDNASTYAYCDRAQDGGSTVFLIIGTGDNVLKSYLSLEFYFFHECLSHVFPRWDDLGGRLSEGYLFALEKSFFRAKCHLLANGFALHSRVVDEDMGAHLRRAGKGAGAQEDLERLYVWLDSNCPRGVLPGLLLELSSMSSASKLPEKLLRIIEFIANQQNAELAGLLQESGKDNLAQLYTQLKARILPTFLH